VARELLIQHIANIVEDRRLVAQECTDIAREQFLNRLGHQLEHQWVARVAFHERSMAGGLAGQALLLEDGSPGLIGQPGQLQRACQRAFSLQVGQFQRSLAGNISASASDTIILDTTRPTVVDITLNGGAQFTNTPDMSASMIGSDTNDLSLVQISNRPDTSLGKLAYAKGYTYAKGSILGIAWSLADAPTNGSTANGQRTVYVQFRDVANNWSLVSSDGIFLDTVAPSGSVAINAGAATTSNVNVTLTLAGDAAAPASGVAAMRFSNEGATWLS